MNPYNYRPVRVDRYKNGVQTGGVFLAGDVKDAVSKVAYVQELLGDVQITQHQLVAPMSFDENQEDEDFGDGGDSWHWNESDLTQTGDGEWTYHGHDAYGNEQDYTVIDTDGDGKPDSIFIDPNPPVDPDPGTEDLTLTGVTVKMGMKVMNGEPQIPMIHLVARQVRSIRIPVAEVDPVQS